MLLDREALQHHWRGLTAVAVVVALLGGAVYGAARRPVASVWPDYPDAVPDSGGSWRDIDDVKRDDVRLLAVRLDMPERVQPRSKVRYVAIVTNRSSKPYSLKKCPAYLLGTGDGDAGTDTTVRGSLGCRTTLDHLRPGETRAFRLQFTLPSGLEGDYAVAWQLMGPLRTEANPVLRVPLTIAG